MKNKIKKILSKRPGLRKNAEESLVQAIQTLPRITNETVAEHREQVLGRARKYIYPLQHSSHRILVLSSLISSGVLILFFGYCTLALYKFNASSTFIYKITQVVPFPIAKAGPSYVAYENYLFELRRYMHYYETQQRVDFSNESGKRQLAEFRKRALQTVVSEAYVKQLAKKHNVTVSDGEVNDALALVRSQNRLSSNDKVFSDVLKDFWGWSVVDFKRELKSQMLEQKVVSVMDVNTSTRAQQALERIQKGEDFASVAKEVSDDSSTKANGGDYGFQIDRTDKDLSPQVINNLFKLKLNETSGIINTGSTLEILKVTDISGSKVRASHIMFAFRPISTYVNPLEQKNAPDQFVNFK